MRSRSLGVIVVAHHLQVLADRCTHLVYLDAGQGLVLAGPVADVVAHPTFIEKYGTTFAREVVA